MTTECKLMPVDVDALAQFIRKVDGNNRMGAGALAEKISEWLAVSVVPQADGVTGALARVYDVIGLHHSHPLHVLLENVENIKRFAGYLGAVEREFFMVPGEPSDEPEDAGAPIDDVCLVSKFPARSVEHYVEQFREALAIIGSRHRGEAKQLRAERDGLRAQLAELPSYMAALETFDADDGTFVRVSDVLGALSACAEQSVTTGYRLLNAGEEILSEDQFLGDDAATWRPMTDCPVFIGMVYSRVLQPVRRLVTVEGEEGAE